MKQKFCIYLNEWHFKIDYKLKKNTLNCNVTNYIRALSRNKLSNFCIYLNDCFGLNHYKLIENTATNYVSAINQNKLIELEQIDINISMKHNTPNKELIMYI